ncbi:protein NETWORKED 3A-like [Cynara cardunculus var. scolymus]|uniref:KIP1-like protein n=1 Tax=Cynara cardunculus var. scolymus TaxID=59895 RepID=A0A103XP84_CYNCS|nr:protein NETWORKED 3A-like [Cynara cardunculus var. scolymus]KVH94429.1 KIP1-like protein [Cynara cardunculus var. scolymus]
MVDSKRKLSAYWWWFDKQNTSITRKSPWLRSTLAELDEKTESMLKIIEEDADSFAERAEMYYKKRPELINLLEDIYRTHRSLALRYDHATKSDSGSSHLYDTYSESFDFDHDQDSREPENNDDREHKEDDDQVRAEEHGSSEVKNLREEIEKIKIENKFEKELLAQKDEEKREAIRQLSLSVDLLKQENMNLKKRIGKDSSKKKNNSSSSFTRVFWGKMFTGKMLYKCH